MTALSAIGRLSPAERRALLEHLLRGADEANLSSTGPRLKPLSRAEPLPLSFGQERIWVFEKLLPGSPTYHSVATLRMRGALDVGALEAALQQLVLRHESLRTVYLDGTEAPKQQVLEHVAVTLPLHAFDELPLSERSAAITEAFREAARRPFDLTRGPLFRFELARSAPDEHSLLIAVHHISADGGSLGVLLEELAQLYGSQAPGRPAALAKLPVQYADFASWQRERLTGESLQERVAFFRKAIDGAPQLLQLPTRAAPERRTYATGHIPVRLSLEVRRKLEQLARETGSTPFMVLLGAFQLLLRRYSGQREVLVGTQVAMRGQPELERVVGFFVNTLVLRANVEDAASFRAHVSSQRDHVLDAFAHQDVPFEKVVEAVNPSRDLRRSVLIQANFNLQNNAIGRPALGDLEVKVELESGNTDVDLDLYLQDENVGGGGGFAGQLQFQRDVFDEELISRMAGHFERLVEALVARPDLAVAQHPLVVGEEREALVHGWNATARAFRAEATLPVRFGEQVDATPTGVALSCGSEHLTYAELRQRVTLLASLLRDIGVGPEVVVGMCVPRSPQMVIAMLGILEAGGAYLPLDPAYPKDRLAFMLEDSGAHVVVTLGSAAEGLPLEGRRVVDVARALSPAEVSGKLPPAPAAAPDQLAYVLYTSGSTGRPKGVQITHRNLVNFLDSMLERPGLRADDVLLSVTSPSFDIAGLELYLPLICGARVVLAQQQDASDGAQLAALIASCGATFMQATPSTWRLLAEAGWPGRSSLVALCGGEALSETLASWLLGRTAALWNMYGPTETTIWSTCEQVKPGEAITLGRPIANTRVYVLDAALQLVPVGVAGRLFIAGEGVARGYLGRPELTTSRFLADPFSGVPGSRMYDTGDLVRWRPDGRIEFLGRDDNQVKLRGFRIELGEIEVALRQQAGVAEAVVLALPGAGGEPALVAYVVPQQGAEMDLTELKAQVRSQLPEYMVPSTLVRLDAFPLTPNGKLDRSALPRPLEASPGAADSFVAPTTALERQLAAAWSEALGLERISLHDDFFALGGQSLLATRLAFKLRERLGVEVGAIALFQYPTVAELAAHLIDLQRAQAEAEAHTEEVDSMSDADVEAMLRQLADGEKA